MNPKTVNEFEHFDEKRAARLLMNEIKAIVPNHANYPEQFEIMKTVSMLICDKVIEEINERPFYIDVERWEKTKEAVSILNHNQ